MLERFLSEAFPNISSEAAAELNAAISHLSARYDNRTAQDEITDLQAALNAAEDTILQLRQEAISHRMGIRNATRGGLDVLAERARQNTEEGYSDQHDDTHNDGSLVSAALAYLLDARMREQGMPGFKDTPPDDWPYPKEEWRQKPNILRQKIIAAALIIADIDRIYRAGHQSL